MEAEARRLFDRLGAAISPRARVGDLRIGDQQMVEIAKALAFDAAILIMDEPTSALSDAEVARLFRVIDDLRQAGTTVLYISHKMNEVFTLADRVTVLRDGQFVASAARGETVARPGGALDGRPRDRRAALRAAPDRRAGDARGRRACRCPAPPGSGRPACATSRSRSAPARCSGVAGLLGAGRTELLEALFGASPSPPTGTIRLERPARPVPQSRTRRSPPGIALVTEDRKTLGLFDRDDRRREHHDPAPRPS